MSDRQEAEDDLRATADSLGADAARLHELETRKRSLDPSDPEVVAISEEAAEIAGRVGTASAAQLELSRDIQEAGAD